MSWAKIHDHYTFNPKIIAVGNEGAGAHVRMIAYCTAQLTDGKVPAAVALMVAGSQALIDRLVAARLLDTDGADYRLHNFGRYQSSASEVRSKQEADRIRKANARNPSDRSPSGFPADGATDSARIRDGVQAPKSKSKSKSEPLQTEEEQKERAPVGAALALIGNPILDLGKADSVAQRKLVDRHLLPATEVLDAQNAARGRVMPKAPPIKPSYTALAGIAGRLDAGKTVEQCLHVVLIYEEEVRGGKTGEHFDAVSPWRPANFERALARTVEMARAVARGDDKAAQRVKAHPADDDALDKLWGDHQ